MKCLIIDAQVSGASGDMFLSALLDLYNPSNSDVSTADKQRQQFIDTFAAKLLQANKLENQAKITIELIRKSQHLMNGINLKIAIKEHSISLTHAKMNEILENIFLALNFSENAKLFSKTAFNILFDAEAKVHGLKKETVHLHEAGSLDTFLDILGTAYLLDQLNLFSAKICIMPVTPGSGTITFSHGTFSVPPPAVTEIIKQFQIPICGSTINEELLTPTGASIIAAFMKINGQNLLTKYPTMVIKIVGMGYGTREVKQVQNGLRILVGEMIEEDFPKEELAIIETNIDDSTGEVLGYLSQKLLEMGAKDVYFTPIYMKKNRPGTKVSVLCDPIEIDTFSSYIMSQTSTIGVRIIKSIKHILQRDFRKFDIKVSGKNFTINCKIAYDKNGKVAHFKPEFEDIKNIAEQTNCTLNEVMLTVNEAINKVIKKST